MGDEDLFMALSDAPRDSIVLIEDVDCAFRNESEEEKRMGFSRSVTLSGLLNAIDGVAAQEGRLLFLTTNHKDRLTEALIRPGRVDGQYYIGRASKEGAGELFDQFFPPVDGVDGKRVAAARADFVAEVETDVHSFAKLQGVLMQARDDPASAAKHMKLLFSEKTFGGFDPTVVQGLKETHATRLEREDNSIQSRIALVEHTAACQGCTSSGCKSAKKLFAHVSSCEEKPKSSCKMCTYLIQLSVVHARKCQIKGDKCPVPFCDRIRQQEAQEESEYVDGLFNMNKDAVSEENGGSRTTENEQEKKFC